MHVSRECGHAGEWTSADDRQHRGTSFTRAELGGWLDDAPSRRDGWFDEPGSSEP